VIGKPDRRKNIEMKKRYISRKKKCELKTTEQLEMSDGRLQN
jgi:hypothetical protein